MTSLIRRLKIEITDEEYLSIKENDINEGWEKFDEVNQNDVHINQQFLILSLASRKLNREKIIAGLMNGNHAMSRNNLRGEAKRYAWSAEKVEQAIQEHEKEIEQLEFLISVFKGYTN
tara:strand:- start:177 stop:530 length:354 start_codon:yes stop_codon:yes gene_type:complete